jgi:cell division septation protein DedD
MSYLHEDFSGRDEGIAAKEHELTLSTAAIFGLFFAQVVLCAIFFGFGYSMGGHKTPSALPAETADSSKGADFSSFKPAAGTTGSVAPVRTAPVAAPAAVEKDESEAPAPAPVVRAAAPTAAAAPAVKPVALGQPAAAPAAAGLFVQVAAISVAHPDDATMLQNALKSKGYAVTQRSGPDNFIHLLLGPYADRAAAEAMRQKLATDGYVAYIK